MKELHVTKPLKVGEIALIPLERISVRRHSAKERFLVYLSKEPAGIVIDSPQGRWAIDICGEQVPLETYIREVEGLQQVLDSLRGQK